MKRVLWVAGTLIAASVIAAPFSKVPPQTAVCEGHEPVARQVSDNNYTSEGFSGQAWCSDGRHEYWNNGTLTAPTPGHNYGSWRYMLVWIGVIVASIVLSQIVKRRRSAQLVR